MSQTNCEEQNPLNVHTRTGVELRTTYNSKFLQSKFGHDIFHCLHIWFIFTTIQAQGLMVQVQATQDVGRLGRYTVGRPPHTTDSS